MRCFTLGVVAVLTAACTGSGGPSVAHMGRGSSSATTKPSSGSESSQTSELAYATCMRAHGVGNFPDPSSSGAIVLSPTSGIDLNSQQFQSAEQACQDDAPQGGAVIAAAVADEQAYLRFSVCMQHHGFPNFPEPKIVGSTAQLLRPPSDSSSSWDPISPQFQMAWKTCAHYLPGDIGRSGPPPDGPATPPSGGAV